MVYHEFSVCVKSHTKTGGELMLDVPVKDLTLPEMQGLKSFHPSERKNGVKSFGNEAEADHQSFPTLEDFLTKLDSNCGFNIEVKYGGTMKDGTEEQENPMEMNLFVDQILKMVLRLGGERRIVFSSFHPDICTMNDVNLRMRDVNEEWRLLIGREVGILHGGGDTSWIVYKRSGWAAIKK